MSPLKDYFLENIGILELAQHNEVLRSYVISLLKQNVNILIFTTNWIKEHCYDIQRENKITWHLKSDNDSPEKFLMDNYKNIHKCQFMITTSLDNGNGGFIKKTWNVPTALVVHDVHTLFEYHSHLDYSNMVAIARVLKHLMLGILRKRSLHANGYDLFFLPSEQVLEYVKKKSYFSPKFKVAPFAINDEESKVSTHNYVRITIPGNIDDKSRDYHTVVKAVTQLSDHHDSILLTLLGKPSSSYGIKIVEQFQKISNAYLKIESFRAFIPQITFDEIMRDTDFLICPMNKIMRFGPVKEKNGYSCVSGNFNDILRFGLPSLIPSSYPIPADLKDVIHSYNSSEELASKIDLWVKKKIFNNLKEPSTSSAFMGRSKEILGEDIMKIIREQSSVS